MWSFLDIFKIMLLFLRQSIKSLVKGLLRRMTGLCEVQRICYGSLKGGVRTIEIESSLFASRLEGIQKLLASLKKSVDDGIFEFRDKRSLILDDVVRQIASEKKIKLHIHTRFQVGVKEALEAIFAFHCLNQKLIAIKNTQYNKEDESHEKMLCELWKNLKPDEPLTTRISKQWQKIGFQGSDPQTDFRGAGLLALESLHYFSKFHRDVCLKVLRNSYGSPLFSEYPFALVAIHVVTFAQELCYLGAAKRYFYNQTGTLGMLDTGECDKLKAKLRWNQEIIALFHDFFSALMVEFSVNWINSRPQSLMAYNLVWTGFQNIVRKKLQRNENFNMEMRTV